MIRSPFAFRTSDRSRSPRSVSRTLLSLALPLLALAAACGDKKPDAGGPYGTLVADAVPKIEKELGLTFKTPPKIESRSGDEVATFVMKQLTSERAKKQIDGQQSAYRVLGLVPDTLDLGGLLQRLLEEQIIGYYDPSTKVLYVVEGAPSVLLQQTVTHELVHALQDQYVAIDSIQGQTDDADRQGSAQAILEGQAVFTQLLVDPNAGPMLKMPGGWDRIRDVIRDGQTGMPIFSSAPRAVKEGLLFPYLGGADFVRRFIEKRPISELLTDLPISSRQILNDDAYFAVDKSKRKVPAVVTLPAPNNGTLVYANTFGEFETRLVLVQHLKDEVLARRGAGGINGDRYAVVRMASGDAVVWASVWDTPADAGDFFDLLADAIRRRYELSRTSIPDGLTTRRLDVPANKTRGARTVTMSVEQRDGRPVVLFMDTPAGVGASPIDLSKISIAR